MASTLKVKRHSEAAEQASPLCGKQMCHLQARWVTLMSLNNVLDNSRSHLQGHLSGRGFYKVTLALQALPLTALQWLEAFSFNSQPSSTFLCLPCLHKGDMILKMSLPEGKKHSILITACKVRWDGCVFYEVAINQCVPYMQTRMGMKQVLQHSIKQNHMKVLILASSKWWAIGIFMQFSLIMWWLWG